MLEKHDLLISQMYFLYYRPYKVTFAAFVAKLVYHQ